MINNQLYCILFTFIPIYKTTAGRLKYCLVIFLSVWVINCFAGALPQVSIVADKMQGRPFQQIARPGCYGNRGVLINNTGRLFDIAFDLISCPLAGQIYLETKIKYQAALERLAAETGKAFKF